MTSDQFPVFRLATMLARQASSPIATRIKEYAKQHPVFSRTVCARTAEVYRSAEWRARVLALQAAGGSRAAATTAWTARPPAPLSGNEAREMGGDILGEAVIFLLGALILTYEYNRQMNNQEAKEQEERSAWAALLVLLEETKHELDSQQKEIDRLLALLKEARSKPSEPTEPSEPSDPSKKAPDSHGDHLKPSRGSSSYTPGSKDLDPVIESRKRYCKTNNEHLLLKNFIRKHGVYLNRPSEFQLNMEAALPHFHRLSSRYYQQYAAPPVRISSNYLHDLIPQHPTLLQQYLAYYNEPLVPLDLSLKSTTPITPPCTPPPSQKRKAVNENGHENPPKIFRHFEETETKDDSSEKLSEKAEKRKVDDENSNDSDSPDAKKLKFSKQFFEELKTCLPPEPDSKSDRSSPEVVEIKDVEERPKKPPKPPQPLKKSKAVRRLMFDEDKTSPVSGTIIRDLAEDETLVVRKGDIDPAFNVVEVTEEAKALIATIENRLGRYICRLCRRLYGDAFALAQHRCSRIVHIEYRCPECDKVFNCPANLASHRRWHKPRVPGATKRKDPPSTEAGRFPCQICGKLFRRQAYLKKHLLAHEQPENEEKEPSAFRQVHAEYSAFQPETLRDSNFNTFWSKIPPPPAEVSWEGMQRSVHPSSCSSEDSRSLDVTGSEDEGGGSGEGEG